MRSMFPSNDRHEERVLATVAYAVMLTGAFVLPLALYLWKRKESPLIAFHALQAIFLWLAVVPLSFIAVMAMSMLPVLVSVVVGSEIPPIALIAMWLAGIAFYGGLLLLALRAAIGAYRGERKEIPIIGRIAARVLGDDAGLPPR